MPKISDTRKQRADKLLERLHNGPTLCKESSGQPFIPDDAAMRNVRIWLQSWIIPEVIDLIPELKRK